MFELLHGFWVVFLGGGFFGKGGGEGATWCRLTSLVQVSSLTNVGQPTGGVREMLNATAVAIGQGQWRLIRRGEKSIPVRARAAARQVDEWAVGYLDSKMDWKGGG